MVKEKSFYNFATYTSTCGVCKYINLFMNFCMQICYYVVKLWYTVSHFLFTLQIFRKAHESILVLNVSCCKPVLKCLWCIFLQIILIAKISSPKSVIPGKSWNKSVANKSWFTIHWYAYFKMKNLKVLSKNFKLWSNKFLFIFRNLTPLSF